MISGTVDSVKSRMTFGRCRSLPRVTDRNTNSATNSNGGACVAIKTRSRCASLTTLDTFLNEKAK